MKIENDDILLLASLLWNLFTAYIIKSTLAYLSQISESKNKHRKLPAERIVKAGRNACLVLYITYINILADKESVEFQSSFLE